MSSGLGIAAGRSIQSQFDDAIACLQLTLSELTAAHDLISRNSVATSSGGAQEIGSSSEASDGVACLDGENINVGSGKVSIGSQEGAEAPVGESQAEWLRNSEMKAAAVAGKLEEWRHVVGSHQSASRVLRWSTSGMGASP